VLHALALVSKQRKVLSQNMTHWYSKSAVAREEAVSRRTVQRSCRLWETLPKSRNEAQVIDQTERVNLDAFRSFRTSIKKLERRGFPSGGTRGWSHKWDRLIKTLRDRKSFGRTREDRIKIIRAEIDAMSNYEQGALMWEFPSFFRPAAHKMVQDRRDFIVQLKTE